MISFRCIRQIQSCRPFICLHAEKSKLSRSLHMSLVRKELFTVQDAKDFKEKVLESDIPVVVDFHASWCGPCKTLRPRLEGIVAAKEDKIHLATVDIDEHTELAMEYGVTAVPSVFGFRNGNVTDRFVGLIDDDKIKSFVDKLIGPV